MLNLRAVLTALSLCALVSGPLFAQENSASLVDVQKIWDAGAHNAFTDLLFHDRTWYCVFREGQSHVSQEGGIRVLVSSDGAQWTSATKVTLPDVDLRDPKISVAPDGRLCLTAAGFWHQAKETESSFYSYVWYSQDGQNWGDPIPVGDLNHWLWRIVWHKGIGYAVGYTKAENRLRARLYQTDDGRTFRTLVTNIFPDQGYVNETAILFLPNEEALCLIRRDTAAPSDALLGRASPPYRDWKFNHLGVRLGGPQMLQIPDGRIVVAGRLGGTTQLWWLNAEQPELTKLLTLPSGGDTSYPGLVFHDNLLWVSYYSSHEGKASIYLARVKLP